MNVVVASPSLPRRLRQLEGETRQAQEIGRMRLFLAGTLFAAAFAAVAVRLVVITLMQEGAEPRLAASDTMAPLPIERADIVDRNGVVLATNLVTASLYANPRQILDAQEAARELAQVLPDLDPAETVGKLNAERSFVWLQRNLTPGQEYEINRLGIPGFYFQREERRVYPHGALTAHVVGFTDIDNHGLAGTERAFDDLLSQGRAPVRLSIDLRVQFLMRRELARAMREFNGIGAAGIVLDAETGEVLALESLPDFDPSQPGDGAEDARFNRAALGVYEMGSTFKIFNTALALDRGTVRLDDSFDATAPIKIGGFTIRDFKPENRWLTVPEILVYSSNIGSAKMALDIGATAQRAFLDRLGMLRPTAIELPERGQPSYPDVWKPINTMTIAYGHGIAVTPVHLAAGVAAILNGGIMRPATLLARTPGQIADGERVISEETSATMRRLLRMVVEIGTGRKADVPGYLVGGKTGTAEKTQDGRYRTDASIASFIAAFPMSAPRYVVLAMIDEPKPNAQSHGYATGGWVAAPAVGRLIQRLAPLLGVEPVEDVAPTGEGPVLTTINAIGSAVGSAVGNTVGTAE